MAPPSMASMPLMGITPQGSKEQMVWGYDFDLTKASEIGGSTASKHESSDTRHSKLLSQVAKMGVISNEELAKHKNEDDAWIVVDGMVYDVTQFLETHPGGKELILEFMHESDVGDIMRGSDRDVGHHHSKAAFKMLQQFLIGTTDNFNGPTEVAGKTKLNEKKFTVDLTKPIVAQVGHLGDDYDEWVHDPIVCKESPRFFESDALELLTRTYWWVIPLVWLPVTMILEIMAVKNGVKVEFIPIFMLIGASIWTLIEYVLHRFLFHMKASSFWGITFHYIIHGFHHKHPMDGARLVFPPAFSAVISVGLWIFFGSWIARYSIKLAMFGGGLSAYVAYDLTHYFLHFGTSFNEYTRHMKRFHLNHHFKDQTNGFGITNAVWDKVFGTLPVLNEK